MRAINLLPRDQGQKTIRKESLPVLVGACSGVLVAAALGAMFMMGSGKVASQQRKLDDLNRRYQALPPAPAGPSAGQQALAGEQSARVTALSAALSSRVSWDRVFREFSLVLPDDVWLTTLTSAFVAAIEGGYGGAAHAFDATLVELCRDRPCLWGGQAQRCPIQPRLSGSRERPAGQGRIRQ